MNWHRLDSEATEKYAKRRTRKSGVAGRWKGGQRVSQNKYKLPDDVRATAINMVRGYARRAAWYSAARESIIHGTTCNYVTYTSTTVLPDGSTKKELRRQYFPHGSVPGNPTEDKVVRLDKLEHTVEVARMRAVEQALLRVGADIPSDAEREKIREAVKDSCIEGRYFKFEYRNLPVSKAAFYRRRNKFLYEVAVSTEFL